MQINKQVFNRQTNSDTLTRKEVHRELYTNWLAMDIAPGGI